jgi:hypothetical protein
VVAVLRKESSTRCHWIETCRLRMILVAEGGLIWLSLAVLLCGFPPAVAAQSDRQSVGPIGGTVVDQAGAVIVGAQVRITRDDQSSREVLSGDKGQFSLVDLAPEPFRLTVVREGFGTQVFSGTVRPERPTLCRRSCCLLPAQSLKCELDLTPSEVASEQIELAKEQIKEQEEQRVLGFIPNFYVSNYPMPLLISAKQKYELAWKSVTDPVTFVGVGALAGLEGLPRICPREINTASYETPSGPALTVTTAHAATGFWFIPSFRIRCHLYP